MKITVIELICLVFPLLISLYYFLYPSGYQLAYLPQGRMAGIDEPNFTSLSLIISMCAALGVYILKEQKYLRVATIVVVFICFWGILSTASRAGFFGGIVAVCSFFVVKKFRWYISIGVVVIAVFAVLNANAIMDIAGRFLVFGRLQSLSSAHKGLIGAIIDERPFMAYAWDTVNHGKWFIGGGPNLVIQWADLFQHVPHNSLLDIGLAFGKASFYFYSALVILLLIINLLSIGINRICKNSVEKGAQLTPLFFLALTPMYMFLSAGLSMSFIFWLALGSYPLLHPSSHLRKVKAKINGFLYAKVK